MDDFCLARFECILPQVNFAACRNSELSGHGRHGRRRHLGHDLPGAVEPDEHARVAHLARRRGRAVGPAHQPRRRREHGDVQLRQHLHPRGRHHERVPGAANRLEPGRVHAGHADLGVDRRQQRVRRPQQLLRDVRAGHVAREPEPDAQPRPAVRVRERHQGAAGPGAALVRSGLPRCRLRPRPRPPTRPTLSPNCPPASSASRAASVYAGTPGTTIGPGSPRRCGCRASRSATGWASKSVFKGGYGVYYDTLNARDWTPNQDGFDVTTTQPAQQRLRSDLRAGRSEERHPAAGRSLPDARPPAADTSSFPGTRSASTTCWAGASRLRTPTACTRACSGGALGWQRELNARTAIEVAYSGFVRRSAGHLHPPGLPAGAVLEQRQRPRHLGERLPHAERAEPVLHRELHARSRRPTRCSTSGCSGRRPSRRRRSSATACCGPSRR